VIISVIGRNWMKDGGVMNGRGRGGEIHIADLRVGHRRQRRRGADFRGADGVFTSAVDRRNNIVISRSVNHAGVVITWGGGAANDRVRPAVGRSASYIVAGCAGRR